MAERTEQMAVSYKREMNHNYMIIDSSEQEVMGYECKMLASNGIEGLLKFRIRHHEEKKEFYYEITSKQPLNRLLEQRMIKGSEIRSLLLGIAATLNKIEEYLLKEEQILLEPEYIYIEPDQFSVYLCMVPGYSRDFPAAFTSLLQYLLGKVNHQDKDGVVLAYNLYHESLKENYGMPNLLDYLKRGKETIFGEEGKELQVTYEREGDCEQKAYGRDQPGPEMIEREAYGQQQLDTETFGREMFSRDSFRPESKRTKHNSTQKNPADNDVWKKNILKKAIKIILFLAAGEVLLWFLMGEAGLRQFGIWVGTGIAGIALAMSVISNKEKQKNTVKPNNNIKSDNTERADNGERTKNRGESADEKQSWKMVFKENESEGVQLDRERPVEPETTLLADLSGGSNMAVLESTGKDRENIEIPYIPFVIGKHAEMTDYCLNQSTVSRLHLRVDKKEGVYIVTDLNSTNGTTVEGYHLQANETVSIKNGDIIYLADVGYRFSEAIK